MTNRYRITGTQHGIERTVEVQAADHNAAVRAGSHHPHMLCVQSCVLIEDAYKVAFPDFPAADLPAIPAGFEDISWRNDACPHFHNEALDLAIWCDYADAEQREMPDTNRFLLTTGEGELIVASDSWDDILTAINARI